MNLAHTDQKEPAEWLRRFRMLQRFVRLPGDVDRRMRLVAGAEPPIVKAGETVAWVALAAWVLVAGGVLRSAGRGPSRGLE